jgi:hypothetical protein
LAPSSMAADAVTIGAEKDVPHGAANPYPV